MGLLLQVCTCQKQKSWCAVGIGGSSHFWKLLAWSASLLRCCCPQQDCSAAGAAQQSAASLSAPAEGEQCEPTASRCRCDSRGGTAAAAPSWWCASPRPARSATASRLRRWQRQCCHRCGEQPGPLLHGICRRLWLSAELPSVHTPLWRRRCCHMCRIEPAAPLVLSRVIRLKADR